MYENEPEKSMGRMKKYQTAKQDQKGRNDDGNNDKDSFIRGCNQLFVNKIIHKDKFPAER